MEFEPVFYRETHQKARKPRECPLCEVDGCCFDCDVVKQLIGDDDICNGGEK